VNKDGVLNNDEFMPVFCKCGNDTGNVGKCPYFYKIHTKGS
jgi:hypothetical protein